MKKIKTVIVSMILFLGCMSVLFRAYADDPETVNTSVSVNNASPSFTVVPNEEDDDTSNASTSTLPTNEDDAVVFHATGDDPDGDNYYLAICKTNSITANNNNTPTCDGGSWCYSSSTTDGVTTSCSYTTLTSDSENNDWYAFVCDYSSASTCSSSSQGSGDSGSPFIVNHKPTYTLLTDGGVAFDPGDTATFTSTASDTDTYGTTDDNLYLLVCDSSGVSQSNPYATPSCNGSQLTLGTASLTNPTSDYPINNPYPDGTFNAYGYVYDQHNLLATAGQLDSWTVNNMTPTVAIDSFNTTTLTLTESTTTNLIANVTVTDQNSCQDITSGGSVVIDLFGNWTDGGWTGTHTECDQAGESDPDRCYSAVTCIVDGVTDSCAGSTDNSVAYDCTVPVQYYAEATGTGSQHVSDYWHSYITVLDDDSATDADSVTNLSVNLLIAFSADNSINFGALDAGATSTNQTVLVTSTGNTTIDTEISGTNMMSGSDPIAIGNQEYSSASFVHNAGTDVTTIPVELNLGVPRTYWSTAPVLGTSNIYWSLYIPVATPSGTYTGTNTLTAVQGAW